MYYSKVFYLNIYCAFFFIFSYDYVQITSGSGHIIGTYCGQMTGQKVHVAGDYALISFHTDSSIQEKGFKMFFSAALLGWFH